MSWAEKRLGDVLTLKRGYDLTEAQRHEGDVPVVSSSGITGSHNVAMAKGPGVVTGRYGTMGEVFYLEQDFWPHNTALYVQDFKDNEPRFVSYFLKQVLRGTNSNKAAVPGVNRNDLHERRVSIPDVASQKRIVGHLTPFDDLIENNGRRVSLLEQSASLMYREWFVQLRFPGHEHAKVVDGVPEGWRRTTVGAEVDFLSRGITPTYDEDAEALVINQKCIRDRVLDLGKARRQSKKIPDAKLVILGDVLINSTGEGTLGRVAQVIVETPQCTVDSHVTIARPSSRIGRFYFGQCLAAVEVLLAGMGRGATNQTELSRQDIAELKVLVPSRGLADRFEESAGLVYGQIAVLLEQNRKLREARDLLLPRLMSGEVEV